MQKYIYIWEKLDGCTIQIPPTHTFARWAKLQELKKTLSKEIARTEQILKMIQDMRDLPVPTEKEINFENNVSIRVTDEKIIISVPSEIYTTATHAQGIYQILQRVDEKLKQRLKAVTNLEKMLEKAKIPAE